ncbi:MAG: AMP-binding protein [Myxococcota bacterium]
MVAPVPRHGPHPGFVIAPICQGVGSVFIPTMRPVKRPGVWLRPCIHRHRGTASFAPNFATTLAVRRIKGPTSRSGTCPASRSWAAAPSRIQAETMRAFTKVFSEKCNLPTTAIMPAYGMAEATLAITLKPAAEGFRTLTIDADTFAEQGKAEPAVEGRTAIEHVACGVPFSGHEVAVLDERGNRMPDGHEGELCHRGPSVTAGYYNNPEATAAAYRDGWLRTGDLGFVLDGQTYVTGRIKDLIIVNGRNVHPQAVEWIVGELDGVRKGNVIAFSVPGELGEELVVSLETKLRGEDAAPLVEAARQAIQRELSLSVREVLCLPAGTLPKTSSGKLQRRKTREQYLKGELGNDGPRTYGSSADRLTLARHVARSMWSRAKAALRG